MFTVKITFFKHLLKKRSFNIVFQRKTVKNVYDIKIFFKKNTLNLNQVFHILELHQIHTIQVLNCRQQVLKSVKRSALNSFKL